MRRRAMMVLASAALAGSLLASDAQARGGSRHGGGDGAGHMDRFGGAHSGARLGDFGGARVGGIGGSYMTGILRSADGYVAGTGYGTGILRGRFSVLAASALAQQTATPNSSTGASAPALVPTIGEE